MNINTKEYWENRFASKDWEEKGGHFQTIQFAKDIVQLINIPSDYSGKILDFGCALGDAIPIYREHFQRASLIGVDHAKAAILKCKERYVGIAEFINCNHLEIPKADVIISCSVFEHLSNQMDVVKHLLTKCVDLFIFVPYKEVIRPNSEHVNSYDENSFRQFGAYNTTVFLTKAWSQFGRKLWIDVYLKNLLRPFFNKKIVRRNRMIMFQFRGRLQNE